MTLPHGNGVHGTYVNAQARHPVGGQKITLEPMPSRDINGDSANSYQLLASHAPFIRFAWLNASQTFVLLSLLFGTLIIFATPPLRGPDETAHFLRAYGLALGDFVPVIPEGKTRKGIFLPPALREGFDYFERIQVGEKSPDFSYWPVMSHWARAPASSVTANSLPSFVPYAGSEGYSPAAYLPHTAAALVANFLELGFLPTIYLMRLAGLAAMTAVLAYAIALTPQLKWALFAIAMIPSALYGRCVISADSASVSYGMVIVALSLRALCSVDERPVRYSAFLTLCALSKPPNLALILLPLMHRRLRVLLKHWPLLALMILPALAAAAAWTIVSSADVAAWRLAELTGKDTGEFDPASKLLMLIERPAHFLTALLGSLNPKDIAVLWRQLIGVLGLFDTVLQSWVYPTVSILLTVTFFNRLEIDRLRRIRAVAIASITTLAYSLSVFLIFYLIWTPPDAAMIWGIQGRYFVPVLPLVAIIMSGAFDLRMGETVRSVAALGVAVLSGSACLEAILRTDWRWALGG